MTEERAAPKFAVSHGLQADVFLEFDHFADRPILDFAQRALAHFTVAKLVTRFDKLLRPQQAADVVGAKGRLAVHDDPHAVAAV